MNIGLIIAVIFQAITWIYILTTLVSLSNRLDALESLPDTSIDTSDPKHIVITTGVHRHTVIIPEKSL